MKYVSTYEEGLSPEMQQKAKDELGETPEIQMQCLKELRRLINDETDLRSQNDDAFLIRFLRLRKYDVRRAFTTLRNYYIFKARYSRSVTDFKPSELLPLFEKNSFLMLPYRHPSGAIVCYMKVADYNIDEVTREDLCAVCLVAIECVLRYDATQVGGFIMLFDEDNLSLRLVKHYANFKFLNRVVRFLQNCFPGRLKGIHFLNEPFYLSLLLNIFKTLISEKLSKRIFCHGSNLNSLHEHIPADILPEELGGNLGPIGPLVADFRNKIMNCEASIEEMITYGFNEKKIQHLKRQDSRSIFFK